MSDLVLRRKITVKAHGSTLVLVKRPVESIEHVLQKALLWALYLPQYPDLRVEVPLPQPSRYKPDLLALQGQQPLFWGECGVVSVDKLNDLLARFRGTHFCFSKWNVAIEPFAGLIERALRGKRRTAPIELIRFPREAVDAIEPDGTITLPREAVARRRWD